MLQVPADGGNELRMRAAAQNDDALPRVVSFTRRHWSRYPCRKRPREALEPCRHVGAKVDAQRAAPALGQHLEVAARLRRLDDAKRVALPRHSQIHRVVTGDLQEDSSIGPALVRL